MFVLRFPARPFSGLVDEATSPSFIFLTWLSRLVSALLNVLEGVYTLYTYSDISICSNMAQVSLKVLISNPYHWKCDLFSHPLGNSCRSILFSSSGGILLKVISVSRSEKSLKGMEQGLHIACLIAYFSLEIALRGAKYLS